MSAEAKIHIKKSWIFQQCNMYNVHMGLPGQVPHSTYQKCITSHKFPINTKLNCKLCITCGLQTISEKMTNVYGQAPIHIIKKNPGYPDNAVCTMYTQDFVDNPHI